MKKFITKNEEQTNRLVIKILWVLVFLQFPVAFLLALAGVFLEPLQSYLLNGLFSAGIALIATLLCKNARFQHVLKYFAVGGLFVMVAMLLVVQGNESAYQVCWAVPVAISCLYFDPVLALSAGIGAFFFQITVAAIRPITFLPDPEGYTAILIGQSLMLFAMVIVLLFLARKTRGLLNELLDSEEREKLLAAIQKAVAKLQETFQVVNSAARQFTSSTGEVSQAMERVVQSTGEISTQAKDTLVQNEKTLALTGDLANFAREVAGISTQASSLMGQTRELAVEEEETVNDFVAKMEYFNMKITEMNTSLESLRKSSGRISEINDTIRGITDQTRLLSLNASIEAARSGEYGRGFAVVAQNIRKLAQLSDKSTERIEQTVLEIGEVFETVSKEIGDAVLFLREGLEMISNTNSALMRIREACAESARLINEINQGNQRQADGMATITGYLQEIAKNARTISEATEETAAGSEQTSAAVQEITAQAQYLLKVAGDLNIMLRNTRRDRIAN